MPGRPSAPIGEDRVTLVLHREDSRLRVESGCLCIDRPGQRPLRLPPHRVEAIICHGAVGLSGAVAALAMRHGVDIAFFTAGGRFVGRIEPAPPGEPDDDPPPTGAPAEGTVAFEGEQAQWRIHLAGEGLPWARTFVDAKIRNARGLLQRARRRPELPADEAQPLDSAIAALDHALRHTATAASLDALRGCEGTAARAWFAVLPLLLLGDARGEFPFHGRSRRPPANPFNALLSFLYALLQRDVLAALQGAGLDPRVGFLHAPRRGRAALAFDLMEELRPVLADRLALALINRRQIRPEHFTPAPEGGFRLTHDGLQNLFAERHRRAQTDIAWPHAPGGRTPLGRIPTLLARNLAAALRAGQPGRRTPFLPDL